MNKLNSVCPVCDGQVDIDHNVEVSEIVVCRECATRLVVERKQEEKIVLGEAPAVEEDWGE